MDDYDAYNVQVETTAMMLVISVILSLTVGPYVIFWYASQRCVYTKFCHWETDGQKHRCCNNDDMFIINDDEVDPIMEADSDEDNMIYARCNSCYSEEYHTTVSLYSQCIKRHSMLNR